MESLRTMVHEFLGVEFDQETLGRLLPLIERQLERMRELQAIDLGPDEPRSMHYINDLRLLHYE